MIGKNDSINFDGCYIIDFIVPVSSCFLQSTLYCSCFILLPSAHSPTHSFRLPLSISLTITLFGCTHITSSFNLIVSFSFQPNLFLKNNPQRSLDKVLILDRYSLLEAELWWFYFSLSLYIKQEIQHDVRRNVLVCSAAEGYLLIYSTQAYVGTRQKYWISSNLVSHSWKLWFKHFDFYLAVTEKDTKG